MNYRKLPPPPIRNMEQIMDIEGDPNKQDHYLRCLTEPRRTKELLESPLHMNKITNSASKENHIKTRMPPPVTKSNKYLALIDPISEDLLLMPRHTKEMLESPLHTPMRSKDVARDPNTLGKCEHILTEPRRIKQLLESPLHMKKTPKYADPMSENLFLMPRHTKELRQSPLNSNASIRSTSTSKIKMTSASKPKEVPIPEPQGRKIVRKLRRKLDFNKEAMDKTEVRILSYLKQIPLFHVIAKRSIEQLRGQDLVRIINHLLGFTGILVKPLNTVNYIDQTILAMQQLNYPHELSKSCLLLSRSSFHHVRLMLDFLLDFAPTGSDFDNFEFYEKEYAIWRDNPQQSALQDELESVKPEQIETASLEQQLSDLLEEESKVQTQLTASQKQLQALSLQSLEHEQRLGQLCIEIWRNNQQLKEWENKP